MPKILMAVGLCALFAQSIASAGALNVSVPPEGYPPFIIIKNKQVSGIVIDPLKKAAEATGTEIEFHFLPKKRASRLIKQKKLDAQMKSKAWVEHPEDFLWSESITDLQDIILYNPESDDGFNSLAALQGYEIATHLGYSYPTLNVLFEQGKAKRVDYQTEQEMLTATAIKRPSTKRVTIMNEYVARWLLKDMPEAATHIKLGDYIVDSAPLMFQFANTEQNKKLLPKLNAHIKRMKKNKEIESIIKNILSSKALD